MTDERVPVHEVLFAALALERLLLAVLAVVDSKLGRRREALAAVAARHLGGESLGVSFQLLSA